MVKIRLARRGRKKLAMYDVVVADARAPRDGRFIEKIGTYNPLSNPASIVLKDDRAFHWLMNGAQPSDTVKAMLSYRGIMMKKHLQIGVIKGALTQEQADSKLAEWVKSKETKIQSKRDTLAQSKQAQAKARKEAEIKVKEARAEAIRKKQLVAAAPAEAAPEENAEAPAAENTEAQG
jgi:small subunit ribosomal protein S16